MLQLIKLIINSKEGIGCLYDNSYLLNQPVFENVGLIVKQTFLCVCVT